MHNLTSPTSPTSPGSFRRPVRVTITIPYIAYQSLVERSNRQGRSLSNLAAFLLESSLKMEEAREPAAIHPK